jgi:hypothetical protein
MPRIVTILGSFLLLCLGSAASSTASADGDSLLECARENTPKKSSKQKVEFHSIDRMGKGRDISASVAWERADDGKSRVLLRVHKPTDLEGAGLLLIEKSERTDMFIYLPDLKKVKRVTSHMLSGSLFGSDFTYEDFMQFQGISVGGRREELAGATLDGVAVRVLAQYPAEEAGSAYERIVSFWDPEYCVPLKVEMYESGDAPRKVLRVDRGSLFQSDGVVLPQKAEMKDLRDETSTQLSVHDIEIDVKIPRKYFSKSGLEQPRLY